jgi:hypothetical protein
MKNLVKILSIITFLLATFTVASICYEGMILEWLSFVGVLILTTDLAFLLSTIIGTFFYRRNKTLFYSHLFSLSAILIAVVIHLIYGRDIPKFLFLIWEFYILYFYGIIVCKKLWQNHVKPMK